MTPAYTRPCAQNMHASQCSGVTTNWTQCLTLVDFSGAFCQAHQNQSRWLNQPARSIHVEEFEEHALGGRCCGLVKGDGRLCNNYVGASNVFAYCHLHGTQAFPRGSVPGNLELLEMLLEFARWREDWSSTSRSRSDSIPAKSSDLSPQQHTSSQIGTTGRPALDAPSGSENINQDIMTDVNMNNSAEGPSFKFSPISTEDFGGLTRGSLKPQPRQGKTESEFKFDFTSGPSSTSAWMPRWTPADALRSYKRKSTTYDTLPKFSSKHQASFGTIPWPVLTHPKYIHVFSINWMAVEEFFNSIRSP